MPGTTKSRGVSGKDSSIPAGTSFIRWFFRPTILFQTSLIAGILALWPYALHRLPSIENRTEYKSTFRQIQIHPKPDRPVPENLVEQVRALSELPDEFSILDQNLSADIAEAFHRHPWVSKVARVLKTSSATILVELEYRNPVAMIQVTGGRIPIDLFGYLLPSSDLTPEEAGQFPMIQNVPYRHEMRSGMRLEDPALLAALQLASLLKEKWAPLKLEAIRIPQNESSKMPEKDLQFQLIGRGGSRILWGRAPTVQHPGELSPTQKIRRLEKYLADFGDYVRPSGPYEIDIRHWQEISRHTLVTNSAPVKPLKNSKDEARHLNSDARKKSRN